MKIENLDKANNIQRKLAKYKTLKTIMSLKWISFNASNEEVIINSTDKEEESLVAAIMDWLNTTINNLEKEFEEL